MTGRFGRLTDAMLGGVRTARARARELREEFRTSDEPERLLVAPLLPGERLRYVGLASLRTAQTHRAGGELADRMAGEIAEALDPRALFGLLHIVNPVAWLDAVMTPVRLASGMLLHPARAAAVAAGPSEQTAPESVPGHQPAHREPLPLTEEQEAFRALFRLSPYRPLADQLAEIAYRRRYAFSGDLATHAGSLLLFLDRYTGTPLAVTDSHLHLLRMGRRPDEGRPDRRQPRLLWSVRRDRVARIDSEGGPTRLLRFPSTVVFDDGSWIRIVNPTIHDDQSRFLAAIEGIPGQRPGP
ncbi:hypothetical protein V1634_19505 [Plantactinospora veratri]|uniref:Uncharacterized protein n=1 Tax=Plantactinospora veratri TaxID=1436122 RepID=A0ABU7SGD9_9ACTN